ncbi:MAG: glycosyltransferase [Verrucomicrobia bacterium]|nr:glycosyltransferase [Verrucomicrobiota bacterium]
MAPKTTPSSPDARPPEKKPSLPVAIVIPWFGRGHNGGAEMHAWQLAERMARRGHVIEVITTCCRSYQDDWAVNHLESGVTTEPEGFQVRRFPVAPRDRPAFDRINGKLLATPRTYLRPGISPLTPAEEAVFADELIKTPALLDYLEAHAEEYHAFIFLPYLYGTTLRGLPRVAAKAYLQPCLHDEAYAYLTLTFDAFFAARGLLYLSDGEAALAAKIYGPGILPKSVVTGAGVDVISTACDDAVLQPLHGAPFVLCLGRQDTGKNTDMLARAYARFRAQHPKADLSLVLAGPGQVALPENCPGLFNLGLVSEAQKNSLLTHCRALFHPSANESYSRVLMEAWRAGRPAAAHTDCLATAIAVTQAGGGWLARTEDEWAALFAKVAGGGADLATLGAAGTSYAAHYSDWDAVIDRCEAALWPAQPLPLAIVQARAIHQILPNFNPGDAISNQARFLRDMLRALGHTSDIYSWDAAPEVAHDTIRASAQPPPAGCTLLYHHSIGSPVTTLASEHEGPRCLIYHNITPSDFFIPYLPIHARLARQGREQLAQLADRFPVSVGDSTYNALELADVGFHEPGVLPICIDPAKWQFAPDTGLTERLADGRKNLIFVGRLCPNKKQEDLIYAFAKYRELDSASRLVLVGGPVLRNDLYFRALNRLVEHLGLADHVIITGHVTDAQLLACYRQAHLFWSMSEHEGFGVPLIEAMWFDIPVLAFASSAVPETMNGAGRLFRDKTDLTAVAEMARQLVHDVKLREEVIEAQRLQRTAYTPAGVAPILTGLLAKLEPASAASVAGPEAIDPALVHSIAVVKLDHIGDLVLSTPVFVSLRKRFPKAKITAVVAPSAAPILQGNPHVQEVTLFDAPWFWREPPAGKRLATKLAANNEVIRHLSAQFFDLVVNLRSDHVNVLFAASLPHRWLLSYTNHTDYAALITHPLLRTRAMHITEQHRELLATIGAHHWGPLELHPSTEDVAAVAAIHEFKPGTVAIFTGAGIPLKKWPAIKFIELSRHLRARGIPVVIIGASAEAGLAGEISAQTGAVNLCERFTLLQTAAALARCALLVSNDSAPVHLAAAMHTPVVCLMRPPVREEFCPVGEKHRICCAQDCATPCEGFDPTRSRAAAVCLCIQKLTVEHVFSEAISLLR